MSKSVVKKSVCTPITKEKAKLIASLYIQNNFNKLHTYRAYVGASENQPIGHNYYELFQNPLIIQAIDEQMKMAVEADHVSREKVVLELLKIAEDDTAKNCDRLRALDILSKNMGYQQTNVNLDAKIDGFEINVKQIEEN